MVDAYSPYTAIVARPWLHALGAVSSTLHLKVKYPSRDQIEELIGSQSMARQCLVAIIMHQPEAESSASAKGGLIAIKDSGPIYWCSVGKVKCERLEEIIIDDDPEKFFQVGA